MLIIILKYFYNVYTIHLLFTTVRRCTILHTMHHISAAQCTILRRPRQKMAVVNSLYHEKIMIVYTVRRQIHTVHRQRPCTKRVHERGRCAPKWRARQKWARCYHYTIFFLGGVNYRSSGIYYRSSRTILGRKNARCTILAQKTWHGNCVHRHRALF